MNNPTQNFPLSLLRGIPFKGFLLVFFFILGNLFTGVSTIQGGDDRGTAFNTETGFDRGSIPSLPAFVCREAISSSFEYNISPL